MSDVLYRRPAVSRVAWAIPIVLWTAASVVLLSVSEVELDTTQVVLALVMPGAIFGVWLLTVYSIKRYGDITVTRDTLRVGRHRRPIAQLDRAWLADPANTETLPAGGEVGELMGGSWGSTIGGGDLVSLQLVDGTRVSVQTKDRQGLRTALLRAIDSPGDAPVR
jgi:hypothetical protein